MIEEKVVPLTHEVDVRVITVLAELMRERGEESPSDQTVIDLMRRLGIEADELKLSFDRLRTSGFLIKV